MILEPIVPDRAHRAPLARTRIPRSSAPTAAIPTKHTSLGLVTVDQDDPTYVALDEAPSTRRST